MLPVKFPYSWPPIMLSCYTALHFPPASSWLLNPQVPVLPSIIHTTTPSSITYILTLLHVAGPAFCTNSDTPKIPNTLRFSQSHSSHIPRPSPSSNSPKPYPFPPGISPTPKQRLPPPFSRARLSR